MIKESHGRVITKVMKEADDLRVQLTDRTHELVRNSEEAAEYRKALEEIKKTGTSFDGHQIIYTLGAHLAITVMDKYPQPKQ